MADRLALIIANSDFEDEKLCRLKTPTRDAKALAAVLDDPDIGDFDVTLLMDEEEREIRREIARLYYRRKRSDLLLLYYSGHGIRDAHGDLYLATRDTEMDIAGATALSASFVREQLDKSNSQRKVVMLDCCHSGAFAKAGLGDSVGTEDAFAGSGYGRVILTASDALELSWEGDEWLGEGQPSVFTNFLVEGLRTGAADLDGDGKIELDELYKYVYERVMTSGYAKQTPHKWARKVEGQIVIARSPKSDASPVIDAAAGALGVEGSIVMRPSSTSTPRIERSRSKHDGLTITSPVHLEMVHVPAGEFLMGSDPAKDREAQTDEQPQHTVDLPGFYIGKYLVTNAQYAVFVQSTGHRVPEHWENEESPSGKEDHPVVEVSWKDAVAFCRWLSRETNKFVRLPSEAEWEKAARGTDGRIHPWGNKPPMSKLCNYRGDIGGTTPVGKYSPVGDSPYGCADMMGNVWEWTRSLYEKYPYDVKDGRENLEAIAPRVLRGSSFYPDAYSARCAYRIYRLPLIRYMDYGFRVCVESRKDSISASNLEN